MSWEAYVAMLDDSTMGAAVISAEGALCAKSENFKGQQADFIQWGKYLKDPPLARQHGVSYGEKKLFAVEYSNDFLYARCDDLCLFIKKSKSVFVTGISDSGKSPDDAKAAVIRVSKILEDAGV